MTNMFVYIRCSSKFFLSVSRTKQLSSFSRLRSAQVESNCKVNNESRKRLNPINIQMLSTGLHRHIFGDNASTSFDEKTLNNIINHLKSHELWGTETSVIPDIEFPLPELKGKDIAEHFVNIAKDLSDNHRSLLMNLINNKLPPMPKTWSFTSGWMQYDSDGNSIAVDFPEENALVFDVEVCVQEGNYPTLAAAVSNKHWYLWCSDRLVKDQFSWSEGISLSDLIPLETSRNQIRPEIGWQPKLVIGHNVGFDRTFIKEQYLLEGTETYFLDTMSMHICISGLTGMQRAMSVANKKELSNKDCGDFPGIPFVWADVSSLNNLADVYNLYCDNAVLEKSEREVFVSGTLTEIRESFQELATYCARDVEATYKVLKSITPLFFERFPHPVTFAGLLEMSTMYLPVNHNWERYLHDAQDTYADLQKELKLSLMHLANDACSLLHDNLYKQDPWLWDLNWSTQEIKFRKPKPVPKKKKKKAKIDEEKTEEVQKCVIQSDVEEKEEDTEKELEQTIKKAHITDGSLIMQHMYETAASLRKVKPFLPGYPLWYRELCDRNLQCSAYWEPGPSLISTQMRCVPKLMRLTWDGFPLHYNAKHGWGYMVPDKAFVSQNTDYSDIEFPLRNFLKICTESEKEEKKTETENKSAGVEWSLINEPKEDRNEEARLWEAILGKRESRFNKIPGKLLTSSEHYGIGPFDVNIKGCHFYRLPHKDGPHKRVGNPLSKDFLPKVEDETLKAWGKSQADRALVLSKTLSYWKNAHGRIMSQMVVWLNKEELCKSITENSTYDESCSYGAILPRLVPAGTVTRRAVEPTWLTASNAYEDRLGSELKSMIQSPPGYHFVGADVDSEELWIAALFGDSLFGKMHGCTAFGWMTLQGKKAAGTDMHSRTAKSVGITRSQAKTLNYARIYGAGKPFAQRLLMQFNHRLSPLEAKLRVKKIYAETKGTRKSVSLAETGNEDDDSLSLSSFERKIWAGGSESHMFNKLEEIALSSNPRTPILGCRISRALEPRAVDTNFMTSRVNWVVQSSAVDYLHLMLVNMKWLCKKYDIKGRLSICIHDEVRYLIRSKDRYRAALALQITNLYTRSFFTFQMGVKDLPQSVAFFSFVDIDTVLRKEVDMDSKTPSNPHGLEKGYGIPPGEALDIYRLTEKIDGCWLSE